MCGIAGIVSFNNDPADPAAIRRMTDAMAHRGPDATGYFSEGPVSLGHLRLSIIDLSTAANQPFTDNTSRYQLIFNGEIYNYRSVRDRLGDYAFRTNSDTEVILAAYLKWGPGCLQWLRGMFAFAIWDRQEKELFIARDRMGVKPLYYYTDGDRLIFASELRAILASGLVPRRLDPDALVEYFSYQSVSYPYSMIKGIRQLEAGSWVKTKKGMLEKAVYWDVTAIRTDPDLPDKGGVEKRIRELMLQSVERRLVSDVPVGAFLSGGIDSSAVVGLMAEAGGARPNTFTIAFDEKEYDESAYADIVAKKFNTVHTQILLRPTVFLDELQNALDAMDIPSGDGINTYVVSKAIRQKGVTVALSGAGGDELFAGYPFFHTYLQLQARKGWWKMPAALRRALTSLVCGAQPHGKKDKLSQLLQLPGISIDQVYPIFRQILSPRLLKELTNLGGNGRNFLVTSVGAGLAAKRANLDRLPYLSQVSAAEYLGYTQHTLLKDTDQMSMAVSLEVREPFFDQDLVEFVLAIPDRLKKPAYPKSLLVESLKPMLPDEIVFRKKQGFLFPWNTWLRKDLRSFGDLHIERMAQRPFIAGANLREYWKRFLAGDPNIRWAELWLFIVLDCWLEKNEIEC
jgi:asparagine synthase (glutamine-hydrolysing)